MKWQRDDGADLLRQKKEDEVEERGNMDYHLPINYIFQLSKTGYKDDELA